MPNYAYRCPECDHEFSRFLPLADYKEPQTCPECGHHPAKKLITPVGVIFKGDGWVDKNLRIKKQMRKKNERLDRISEEMKRDAPEMKLAPNVDGERVDSWNDAAKLAKEKGKDTSGYENMARKEKALEKKVVVKPRK